MGSAEKVAIGARVKSGWASAVVLGGSWRAPRFVHRSHLVLSDPAVPRSRQPYHRGFGALQKDAAILRRLIRVVRGAAGRSVSHLLRYCRTHRYAPRTLVIVVGSTVRPETIANEHIRAHAYEGRLFRTEVEDAARRRGLKCRIVRERDLASTAAAELSRSPRAIAQVASDLGREAGRPWRQEEKVAAVAAWLGLR